MRAVPPLTLSLLPLVATACNVTVPPSAQDPASPTSPPAAAPITTVTPTASAAATAAPTTMSTSAAVAATEPTPAGVEAGCYNRCLQQNIMQATSANNTKATCVASCSIANKCADSSTQPACERCCRGHRSRGATFEANTCRCQ